MFNAIYRIEREREEDAVILKVGVVPGATLLTYERDIMPVEVECFQMFRQILTDSREHHVRLPYDRITSTLQRYAGCLEDVTEASLVEYDCHEGNIFVKKMGNGYAIEGILDFERAFWGDPIADFPTAFVFTDDIRKEKPFLNAYLKVSGTKAYTETDAVKYQLYRMYILTIMAAETFRYGFWYGKLQGMWAKWQLKKCLRILGC